MTVDSDGPQAYLGQDAVVDFGRSEIGELADDLRSHHTDDVDFARAAFEHVRDSIQHSWDVQDIRVSISASDTLAHGTGLCFAKAHLLAAILRSQGIPTGFCYQRLTDDGATFMLHGLVAVFLNGNWHRQDPRGTSPASTPSSRSAKNAWPGRSGRGSLNATTAGSSPPPARESSKLSKPRTTFSTSAAADSPAISDSTLLCWRRRRRTHAVTAVRLTAVAGGDRPTRGTVTQP